MSNFLIQNILDVSAAMAAVAATASTSSSIVQPSPSQLSTQLLQPQLDPLLQFLPPTFHETTDKKLPTLHPSSHPEPSLAMLNQMMPRCAAANTASTILPTMLPEMPLNGFPHPQAALMQQLAMMENYRLMNSFYSKIFFVVGNSEKASDFIGLRIENFCFSFFASNFSLQYPFLYIPLIVFWWFLKEIFFLQHTKKEKNLH